MGLLVLKPGQSQANWDELNPRNYIGVEQMNVSFLTIWYSRKSQYDRGGQFKVVVNHELSACPFFNYTAQIGNVETTGTSC